MNMSIFNLGPKSKLIPIILSTFHWSLTLHAGEFPKELIAYAQSLDCIPRTDVPPIWQVVPGSGPKESAAFWCVTKKDAKRIKIASLTIFVRPGAKIRNQCPSQVFGIDVLEDFEVWEPGSADRKKMTLDTLNYVDTGKAGKKTERAKGYIIEASADQKSVGIYFYCDRGRWMKHSYD